MSNKQMHFNDGEGIDHNDLNDMRKMLQKEQADFWYARMVQPNNMAANYDDSFELGGANAVGTIGWALGLVPGAANRGVSLRPGSFIHCTSDGSAPTDTGDYDDTERANWLVTFAGQSFELSANATGDDRWDMVVIDDDFTEVAGDEEERDFEDATTRAKSTDDFPKRVSFASGGASPFSIVEGTPGAGYPAIPTGFERVARLKVRPAATTLATSRANLIADVEDHTYPIGRRWVGCMALEAQREVDGTMGDWLPSGTQKVTVSDSGNSLYYFPKDLTGRSDARLLGVYVAHESNESFTVEVVRVNFDGSTEAVLSTLTVGTTDGAHRNVMAFGNGTLPIWGNGTPCGTAAEVGGGGVAIGSFGHVHSTVAVKVTSGSGVGTNHTTICAVGFVFAVN